MSTSLSFTQYLNISDYKSSSHYKASRWKCKTTEVALDTGDLRSDAMGTYLSTRFTTRVINFNKNKI